MIKFKNSTHPRPTGGFSLIEVMVAVVILATGLLALAALQGSLTRASAEAKVRGRVAAMLTARMEELRLQSGGLADGTVTTPSTTNDCDPAAPEATDWIDCTREEANLGSLTVVQTVNMWSGASTFTQAATTDPDLAQFRRITLAASWDDAAGSPHTLTSSTDVSGLSLVTSLVQAPDSSEAGGSNPVVRQDSPVTAGVIPIALGNGQSSAASNPTPEIVGRNNNQTVVGTRYNVLTYVPDGNAAIIQRRFENDIIKCSCQYGAGGNNLPEIYRTAQWPAVWVGDRYDLAENATEVPAPGQTYASGPRSGVTQSALCQECCRDHHDSGQAGETKFDPERTGGVTKYDLNGQNQLAAVGNTTNATYVNSCRVIRVDGFWRTASDLYSRQFGLLETRPVSAVAAKSGLPTQAATDAYSLFVRDYALGYQTQVATSGTAPAGAQAMYDDAARGLNAPTVLIAAVSSSDFRYVHGRGLYIDYLEPVARQRIADVLADDGTSGRCPAALADKSECILPFLPFTTINLTEIANWLASDPNILTINSGNLLATDPSLPSGGRTVGRAIGTADNEGDIRKSNSGVAVSTAIPAAVDPTDATELGEDAQTFQVGGTVATGDSFDIQVVSGGINPYLFFSLNTNPVVTGECLKPGTGNYRCGTNATLDGTAGGSVRIDNYNSETTVDTAYTLAQVSAICTGYDAGYNSSGPATFTLAVPTFTNYAVSTASINGTAATSIGAPVLDGKKIPDNTQATGYRYESTTVAFASVPANAVVNITLQAESTVSGTLQSCTMSHANGNNKPWVVSSLVWSMPWTQE